MLTNSNTQLCFTESIANHNTNTDTTNAPASFKILKHRRDVPDRETSVYIIETGPHLDTNGTHYLDHQWPTKLINIKSLIGPPTWTGDVEDKTQYNFALRFYRFEVSESNECAFLNSFRSAVIDNYGEASRRIGMPLEEQEDILTKEELYPVKSMVPKFINARREISVYDWKYYEEIGDDTYLHWHLGSQGRLHRENCGDFMSFTRLPYDVVWQFGFYVKPIDDEEEDFFSNASKYKLVSKESYG
tara:strand:- start:14444 stop:15178 length:735 start_codon:yes stop_codon:yes gene_type:complete